MSLRGPLPPRRRGGGSRTTPYSLQTIGPRAAMALGVVAIVWLTAITIVYSVLFSQNQNRFETTRNLIRNIHTDQSPKGFMANLAGNQIIPVGVVFIPLTNWTTTGGAPVYDDSNGAFNGTSGIWTTKNPGRYQVSGIACWVAGTFSLRQMIFFTNGNPAAIPLHSGEGLFNAYCNEMSLTMDLTLGMTVQIQVLHGAAVPLTITVPTLFSIERLAV